MEIFGTIESFTHKHGKPLALKLEVGKVDLAELAQLSHLGTLRFTIEVAQTPLWPDDDVASKVEHALLPAGRGAE